jgi:hypothetical protein
MPIVLQIQCYKVKMLALLEYNASKGAALKKNLEV